MFTSDGETTVSMFCQSSLSSVAIPVVLRSNRNNGWASRFHLKLCLAVEIVGSHVVVAEWLRRWTRNPLGFPRVGSNPTDYGEVFCNIGNIPNRSRHNMCMFSRNHLVLFEPGIHQFPYYPLCIIFIAGERFLVCLLITIYEAVVKLSSCRAEWRSGSVLGP